VIRVKPERIRAYSIKYAFNQSLAVPAQVAFDWCTDYQPNDFAIMKEKGRRDVQKITDDTILLTETARKNNRSIKKTKLVRLNRPSLSWTNTHIAGPNRHSQFLYKIVPEGKTRCRLHFQGLLVQYSRKPLNHHQLNRIAREECREDSTVWRHLAAALKRQRPIARSNSPIPNA
jgi:hypothetical protein